MSPTFVFPKKGEILPKYQVKCIRCGCDLLRATCFTRASCLPCRRESWTKTANGKARRARAQARWCRVIFHHAGYELTDEGFKEFLHDLKRSELCYRTEIESRFARADLTVIKKRARRAARHVS